MANFTIVIPDDKVAAVVQAFATQYGYQENIDDPANPGTQIPNPINKAAFAKNIIRSFVREVYIGAQVKEIEATRQATIDTASADLDTVTVD